MILRHFPGQGPVSNLNNGRLSYFGEKNVVVYARSSDISYSEHSAPLSIKSTLQGSEVYEIEGVPMAVDESSYLVLNDGQRYASHIYSEREVESLCVFFREGFATQTLAGLVSSNERLLDNPELNHSQPLLFFQQLHQRDQIVSPLLKTLHSGIEQGCADQLWLDQQMHSLMNALLVVHRKVCKSVFEFPAAKLATRVELYRRLHIARDYIDSCSDSQLELEDISRVACLSQHHFLRLFKQEFRITPHQYLVEKRLTAARSLLSTTDMSIIDICLRVGFQDHSSFSRLFKKRFGRSPGEFRRKYDA
jgi:AraC family transcriptional regulator